jgi:hypothetical protein
LTIDKEEILNLADPLYPERHNEPLFNILNEKLNASIFNYKCDKFIYNIDYNLFFLIMILFNKFGDDYRIYTKIQFELLTTSFFTNRFDSNYSYNQYKKYILI